MLLLDEPLPRSISGTSEDLMRIVLDWHCPRPQRDRGAARHRAGAAPFSDHRLLVAREPIAFRTDERVLTAANLARHASRPPFSTTTPRCAIRTTAGGAGTNIIGWLIPTLRHSISCAALAGCMALAFGATPIGASCCCGG